jgi:hypothetical protein
MPACAGRSRRRALLGDLEALDCCFEHQHNGWVPRDVWTCRTYEEAARDLRISPRRVRALRLAFYLRRCGHPGHKRRISVDSISDELVWRASATRWKRTTRPMFFVLKLLAGIILEAM